MSDIWDAATDPEKRVFIEELVEGVKVFPDHLEVMVIGAPSLNVTQEEVGLQSYNARVGGAFASLKYTVSLEKRVGCLTLLSRSNLVMAISVNPCRPMIGTKGSSNR